METQTFLAHLFDASRSCVNQAGKDAPRHGIQGKTIYIDPFSQSNSIKNKQTVTKMTIFLRKQRNGSQKNRMRFFPNIDVPFF